MRVTSAAAQPIAFHSPAFQGPLTFRERGVALPFTTPALAGTRVREAQPSGAELVVPNLSGARGFYVLGWPGVRALSTPTVFDTLLYQACCGLRTIDPKQVRDIALEVAREGHAGRAAATAADEALAHDRAQRVRARYLLTIALVEQFDRNSPALSPPAERSADLDRRATDVLHRIAPSLGREASDLATGLANLGDAFAPAGITPAERDARIPRLLMRLEEAHVELADWLRVSFEEDVGGLGQAVRDALASACSHGEAALERSRAALVDPVALLRRWVTTPDQVLGLVPRCEWLLDGWERVSLLWRSADSSTARQAALLEMAALVPVLPREALDWTDLRISEDATRPAYRITSRTDARRAGHAVFTLIERNEKLLAMSA